MNKIIAIILIGTLALVCGCSSVAAPTGASPAEPPAASTQDNTPGNANDTQTPPAGFPGEGGFNRNEIMGKIVGISGNEITIAIGTMSRPEGFGGERGGPPGDGNRPEGGQPRGERPEGAEPGQRRQPPAGGERPAQGDRGGPGGGFPGSFMELEYTGDEVTYTIPDAIDITTGMGENSEKLSVSDLSEGDTLRLSLDEAGQPISIQIFQAND